MVCNAYFMFCSDGLQSNVLLRVSESALKDSNNKHGSPHRLHEKDEVLTKSGLNHGELNSSKYKKQKQKKSKKLKKIMKERLNIDCFRMLGEDSDGSEDATVGALANGKAGNDSRPAKQRQLSKDSTRRMMVNNLEPNSHQVLIK